MGRFYGFKLLLIVHDQGESLSFLLTPGNVDDRKPVPHLARELLAKRLGDKGTLSQPLFEQLFNHGLPLIAPLRKNMKNRLLPLMDKALSRERAIIETINDQLKNISQIAHSRHRRANNFLANLIGGLMTYQHQEKKPSLHLSTSEQALFPALKQYRSQVTYPIWLRR